LIVVDSSVIIDALIPYRTTNERRNRAVKVLDSIAESKLLVFLPRVALIESVSIAYRVTGAEDVVSEVANYLRSFILISEEVIFDAAFEIASKTGSRAIDTYYISVARKTGSIILTSDKVMSTNAVKAGINAYCLLEDNEYQKFLEELSKK